MFVDGVTFEKNFETPQGPITVMADVCLFGSHIVLDELCFYPADSVEALNIGVQRTFEILRELQLFAREQGFLEMTVGFHRTGERRHGRTISFTRRLE